MRHIEIHSSTPQQKQEIRTATGRAEGPAFRELPQPRALSNYENIYVLLFARIIYLKSIICQKDTTLIEFVGIVRGVFKA